MPQLAFIFPVQICLLNLRFMYPIAYSSSSFECSVLLKIQPVQNYIVYLSSMCVTFQPLVASVRNLGITGFRSSFTFISNSSSDFQNILKNPPLLSTYIVWHWSKVLSLFWLDYSSSYWSSCLPTCLPHSVFILSRVILYQSNRIAPLLTVLQRHPISLTVKAKSYMSYKVLQNFYPYTSLTVPLLHLLCYTTLVTLFFKHIRNISALNPLLWHFLLPRMVLLRRACSHLL
jgi:hypothetical protein